MKLILKDKLQKLLASSELLDCEVISWASPVIAFGNYKRSLIATVGLNPSNREFVDKKGNELTGYEKRFQTLSSLKIDCWEALDENGFDLIERSWSDYFQVNPYVGWFKDMDLIISGTNNSFFDIDSKACHLDLIPFATQKKWAFLSKEQQNKLLKISAEVLKDVLINSDIEVLILNGRSVVNNFQQMMNIRLNVQEISDWSLKRSGDRQVKGVAYNGVLKSIKNVDLGREIKVLGYNHNLQSSFGITNELRISIKNWIKGQVDD
jgi:hypothetical protein